ncbi:MAG: sn-glycerol-3-phosphate dehydrogenase subunit C [Anaerolineaceae bacterium 4572_32.2]|nr:MAG: sn-glycerol-3-phosphate dehydrogenase subunit C [Anaerolineaceae bacterium 4572_32.2]
METNSRETNHRMKTKAEPSHPPVWLLMPDSQPKRARSAERLTRPRQAAPPLDEEALRDRLRAIRTDTANHLDELLGQLTSTLQEQYGVTSLEATTAQEAADEIARLASPSRRVLVNRSATVAELRPYLKAHGLEIVETYDEQFVHPDQGVERYWQLEPPSAETAWEAFRPQAITPSPRQSTDIGVLGVNVAAAKDGTVFFVQHLFNISDILERASKIVLVIGVERVVRDRDAAAFVARSQARYGALSVALGVPRRGGDSKGEVPVGRSLTPASPVRDAAHVPMHAILLDNGRRAWLSDPRYQDLFLCIGCRNCLLECPTQPYYGGETGWTPRDYLAAFLRGDSSSLRECITCGRCGARCPLDIDLPAMISEAKAEAGATRWQDQFYCNIGTLFQASSLTAPLSNWLFNWPLARLPMEWVSEMDRERKLPAFHRNTFLNQYRRRSSAPASGRAVVYYPGCYANFTDPELSWAVVGILERNGFRVLVPEHQCCGVACFPYGAKELAQRYARRRLRVFGPLAQEGYTILVSCPSCGTALERDFPYLLPESDDARLVAEQTRDVSDFLWALHQRGELDTDFDPLKLRVGYHTPCHLRVRDLGPENLRLLELIPGMEPIDIDRGCCGMAGSFGMRRAHREESREIGRYLFEELRSPGYDLGITNCAGCEMQMRAGSGRDVVHPLKLLWRAYSNSGSK